MLQAKTEAHASNTGTTRYSSISQFHTFLDFGLRVQSRALGMLRLSGLLVFFACRASRFRPFGL